MALGFLIRYPVASASVLQGLWRNDLAALKGSCPNCAEEQSTSRFGRQGVHGLIYLVRRSRRQPTCTLLACEKRVDMPITACLIYLILLLIFIVNNFSFLLLIFVVNNFSFWTILDTEM